MNIELIKSIYPDMYNISKRLHEFDKKVSDSFIKRYGDNTYDNIVKTHEYNKEIENVSNGILKDTSISKLAQKRYTLFQKYTEITYEIAKTIGYTQTIQYMDILTQYFKQNF